MTSSSRKDHKMSLNGFNEKENSNTHDSQSFQSFLFITQVTSLVSTFIVWVTVSKCLLPKVPFLCQSRKYLGAWYLQIILCQTSLVLSWREQDIFQLIWKGGSSLAKQVLTNYFEVIVTALMWRQKLQ